MRYTLTSALIATAHFATTAKALPAPVLPILRRATYSVVDVGGPASQTFADVPYETVVITKTPKPTTVTKEITVVATPSTSTVFNTVTSDATIPSNAPVVVPFIAPAQASITPATTSSIDSTTATTTSSSAIVWWTPAPAPTVEAASESPIVWWTPEAIETSATSTTTTATTVGSSTEQEVAPTQNYQAPTPSWSSVWYAVPSVTSRPVYPTPLYNSTSTASMMYATPLYNSTSTSVHGAFSTMHAPWNGTVARILGPTAARSGGFVLATAGL